MRISLLVVFYGLFLIVYKCECVNGETRPKKDVRDYTDADIEQLYEEWEENDDEKLPVDELPEHMQTPKHPNIHLNDFGSGNIGDIMKLSKKGKTLMIFVTVSDRPTRTETETITTLWQTSLFNANYEITKFLIDDNRAIFMIKDGSRAWEIKDYLVKQSRCEDVTIENQVYDGMAKLEKQNLKLDL